MKDTIGERDEYIIVGTYIPDDVAVERGLRSSTAGANRMLRLATALRDNGMDVTIITGAISLRPRFRWRLFSRGANISVRGVGILVSPAILVPYASSIFELFAVIATLLSAIRDRRPKAIILYNYYPVNLVVTAISRILLRVPVILDIEDVCLPSVRDWGRGGDHRPLFQLVGYILMKSTILFSSAIIVPTHRFLKTAGIHRRATVITGCMDISTIHNIPTHKMPRNRIQFLISGKLDYEQGIEVVLDAINKFLAQATNSTCDVDFVFCGFCSDKSPIRRMLIDASSMNGRITFLGEVSRLEYGKLMLNTDVCIAMQLPNGRHSACKTPSKVYEYLCMGKIVIASDVGDLWRIPECILLQSACNALSLSARISDVVANWDSYRLRGPSIISYCTANFSSRVVGKRLIEFIEYR